MKTFNKNAVKCRLRKGDEVVVIAGREAGQRGKIDKIDLKNATVTIASINVKKRHIRPSMADQEGGIVDKACPIDMSNVMLWDEKAKSPTRVGFKSEGGKKVRFAKRSGAVLN